MVCGSLVPWSEAENHSEPLVFAALDESDRLVSFRIPIDMEDRMCDFFEEFDGRKKDLGVTGTKVRKGRVAWVEHAFLGICRQVLSSDTLIVSYLPAW